MLNFKNYFTESSLNQLYDSMVKAFPFTTKRQHATDPIIIEDLRLSPYVGMKTLFIKGRAKNEDREYTPIILFKNVEFNPKNKFVEIKSEEKIYKISPIENNDALVRCNCGDFYWRFNYYNHLDKSLYGRVRGQYESKGMFKINPSELPGMCKHLIVLSQVLKPLMN